MTWHLVVCAVFMSETVERPKLFDADALSYLILYILHLRRSWTGGATWQYIHISKHILLLIWVKRFALICSVAETKIICE